MRTLIYLALLGVVVAGVIWGWQKLKYLSASQLGQRSTPTPLAPADGHVAESAAMAYGPDRGPGMLRLTPTQLIFTADSGRVTALERLDILGVSDTRELPDRTLAQAVLAVTTSSETYFFAVGSPAEWEKRLT